MVTPRTYQPIVTPVMDATRNESMENQPVKIFRNLLTKSNKGSIAFIFLLLGSILMTIGTLLAFGVHQSGDANRYIGRGTWLWTNLIDGNGGVLFDSLWTILYLVPNLFISALVYLNPENAAVLSVLSNVILYGALILFMVSTWAGTSSTNLNLLVAFASLLLFFGLPGEITKYLGFYYSSDILFLCLSGYALAALAKGYLQNDPLLIAVAIMTGLVCVFTRPPGVITFLVIIISILFGVFYLTKTFIALAILAPLIIAVIVWPYYINLLLIENKEVSSGMGYVLYNYKYGVIVSGYDRSYIRPPDGMLGYSYMTILRMAYYLIPFRIGYSIPHVITNLLYLSFFGLCFYRGFTILARRGAPGKRVLITALLYVFWMTLFHSMTQVEDWRYELPIWPALWLIAGYGIFAAEDHA